MNTKWINVLIASALVLSVFAIAPAIAQTANPVRDMPASVSPGEDFDVTVTWTAPADAFNSIGLTDNANATASMTVSGNVGWCTPNANNVKSTNNKIEYTWYGPFSSGTSFTAIYNVQVPTDAPEGNYTFDGNLMYYIAGAGPHTEAVTGDSAIMVVRPDLIVTAITPNCGGYLFGNESNTISATVKNNGSGDAGAFNVSFAVDGYSEKVGISGLAAGASTDVSVTDLTLRTAGDLVTINVTIDLGGKSNETIVTVMNNGYKGKRYTGGADITTLQTHTLNVNVLYSVGDSYYISGSSTPWDTYVAHWYTSDLPVPTGAEIEKARLYVYYTYDKVQGMPNNVTLDFGGIRQTIDKFYTDSKGYGSWNYPSGMLAYDVTGNFNPTGTNDAVLENQNQVAGNPSIQGMLLVVIYAHSSEPERTIWINEECDILAAKDSYCVNSEEATAFAPFTGTGPIETDEVSSAKLITVAPQANDGDDKNRLYFNAGEWHGIWDSYAANTQLGINETDVKAYLSSTGNVARFQSHIPAGGTAGDYMEASNAILVIQKGMPISGLTGEVNCSIEPDVTVILYNKTTGNKIAETTSDTNGNYALSAPCSGEYWVNASKTGFKNESQEISITGVAYTLNFIGEHGLTPEDPEMPYVLECVNHWQYPPSVECGLTMAKVLEVVNAWLY